MAAAAMLNFSGSSNMHAQWCRMTSYVSTNLVQLPLNCYQDNDIYGSSTSDLPEHVRGNSGTPAKIVGDTQGY